MKKPAESKTIRTAVTLMAASITSIVLHYSGVVELSPVTLGAAVSAVVSSILMVILRVVTREPIGHEESQDTSEETE
jgi:hypothetical protein